MIKHIEERLSGRAKTTGAYHVRVFHFLNNQSEATKGKKGKAAVKKPLANLPMSDDPLAIIMEKHMCMHGEESPSSRI
ncbi:hypothetical protein M408DRAFT_176998 [Serendipita vermifera MAFF 305830]|uniref:Uncharacterized protein n=1 Tax=Serendipita vermifera MAFF 305830 TaxID=933852 RepID=A0A0C2VZS1_SERVB|nr:hypothetical protein M408DRAFT_176998 [Serendipita vermifera MAFF 305830]